MEFGPVQILVVGFEHGKFEGKILAELRRLREHDIVRLVDLLLVHKDEEGQIEEVEISDLPREEAVEMGALAGALIGLGADGEAGAEAGALAGAERAADGSLLDDEEVWYLADEIPPGSAAGIALLEHRWAIPLRDAIAEAGGQALVDTWIHPQDLIEIGAAAH
ncbi:MAG TPA: DUF6325 family protein [Solirubrobacterales bacterium]